MKSLAFGIAVAIALHSSAFAQSFNVDMGSGPIASSSFGAAAGQPGTWTAVGAILPSPPTYLKDLSGNLTSTGVWATSFLNTPSPFATDYPGTSGDDERLLDDGLVAVAPWSFLITPLQTGTYAVYTYAHTPANTVGVKVNGGPIQLVSGAWTGAYAQGVTHALNTVTVGFDHSMTIQLSDAGRISGVQLVRLDTPFETYCTGTAASCPCGNFGSTGRGCNNSNGTSGNLGAELSATGNASATLANDTFTLSAIGLPNSAGLYFQGTAQLGGGNGVVFGDGLRCVGGTITRIGIVTAAGHASSYPPSPASLRISQQGAVSAGDVRNYQLWYRDPSPTFCTAATFNLTNAVRVTWQP